MKKNIAVIMAALLSVCMTGCGNSEDDVVDKTSKTTTTAQTTEADTTTVTADSTEAATDAAETAAASGNDTAETTNAATPTEAAQTDPNAPTAQDIAEIKAALSTAEKLSSGLDIDLNTAYTGANGTTYNKVTSSDFSSPSEISSYIKTYFTQDAISRDWSELVEGENPYYIDVDGEMYSSIGPRGGRFALQDGEVTVEKTTVDGYTLAIPNNDYGADGYVWVDVVNEGGQWKINGISFGM